MTEKIIEMRRQMDDGSILTFVPHKADRAVNDTDGNPLVQTYATKSEVETRMGDGSVTNVGGTTVGATGRPIFLLDGVPTVCGQVVNTTEGQTIGGEKVFTKGLISYMNGPQVVLKSNSGAFGKVMYQSSLMDEALEILSFNGARECRLAVTPTSSSNSKSVVNKDYVQSSGAGKANNLVHDVGDETISGTKTFSSPVNMGGGMRPQFVGLTSSETGWVRLYYANTSLNLGAIISCTPRAMDGYGASLTGLVYIGGKRGATTNVHIELLTKAVTDRSPSTYGFDKQLAWCERDGVIEIWFRKKSADRDRIHIYMLMNYSNYFVLDGVTTMTTDKFDATGFDFKKMCVVE